MPWAFPVWRAELRIEFQSEVGLHVGQQILYRRKCRIFVIFIENVAEINSAITPNP